MNNGKYIFAQVTSFLSVNEFNRCIAKYNGNYSVKHFTCWHQLMCMFFGQLCNRESLSDLMICLQSQRSKWYHLGMGTGISKSNLAYANENRDWRIFADFAYKLIEEARLICTGSIDFDLDIEGNVYAVDSTTIDLCLSIFWWAKFRSTKAAVKMHTQLDLKTEIPSFIHITDGSVHDVHVMDLIAYETGAFYIMDRGYVDFERLYQIHFAAAFFVTRIKTNTNYRRLYSNPVDKTKGIRCDQIIKLNNHYAAKSYPEKLRRIKYYDSETNKMFEFITNRFDLSAIDIAMLYKYRWKIELFFKWIKQHLKIKSFWGYSENAVRIQIYTAIITYTLVVMMKHKLELKQSTYEILQILSITLLNKTQLNQLFDDTDLQNFKELDSNQLNIF
ncbi:MAG TPA: IS4 family transposase [Chitinophagaceae bacterium]|nr:IS4 family transposase [Chitinophagaceae bacterium]